MLNYVRYAPDMIKTFVKRIALNHYVVSRLSHEGFFTIIHSVHEEMYASIKLERTAVMTRDCH
jgi:hypothetical protein